MLNSVLLDAAQKIIQTNTPTQFIIETHFINGSEGSKFSFYPLEIDRIQIDRNYADRYTDAIDLEMTISAADYALLQDQGQNLKCVLTVTYVNSSGNMVFNPAPITFQYNAMLNDSRDLRKMVPDVHLYTEPDTKVSIRLIDPVVYAIRQTKINTVFQNMTVEQAIYALTSMFGIEQIHLIPPNNTHVYDHITIASHQNIASVFGYLQSTCGVYWSGVNSYITNSILYIYPPFDTNPVYDKAVIFYQVDRGRFGGNQALHKVIDGNVSVVINTQPESLDLSIAGAENVGTGFIFNRASRLTDGFTAIDSQNGATFTEQPALSISLAQSRTLSKDNNNVVHIHGTDNPFPKMSQMLEQQASLMTFIWDQADPFLLDPCQKVVYYYDKKGTMVKKTGIMEKAMYQLVRGERMHTQSMFSCNAKMVLRLAPNESDVL